MKQVVINDFTYTIRDETEFLIVCKTAPVFVGQVIEQNKYDDDGFLVETNHHIVTQEDIDEYKRRLAETLR